MGMNEKKPMGGLMFPKGGKCRKRKKHAGSILQPKEEKWCCLCAMLYGDYGEKRVQEHHVCFGTANRAASEEPGLKANLCAAHHTQGPEAVHRNREMAVELCKKAQEIFEREHSREEWMERIGRNYL